MDAMTLLRQVSDAYRRVKSLVVEANILTESGDENSSQRNEQRARFFYAAPNLIRYEPCGKNGILRVVDGKQVHNTFVGRQFGGPRYHSVPVAEMHRLPHLFRPDFPFAGGDDAFLYQGIEERVASAQILREENDCHVVSVTYEPSPHAGLIISGSAVLFWVNAENRMVIRQQGELGHRFPTEDEVIWSRHTVSVQKMCVNESIPDDTFHFSPPPDAGSDRGVCRGGTVAMGSGSGFVEHGVEDQRRLEHRGSHEWEGDTLAEHSKWKIRGLTLTFQRRLTFSLDESEVNVAERATGPKGAVESSCSLPLR